MKKVLSLVLAGSMILSSMSMAFAATAPKALTDIADSDYKKAIETLVALDVVDGYEDGTFRPAKTVTRAEMAKMLVVTLGYGDLVAGSKSNFSDTQGHWADSYVALAAGKGIVVGTGNGTFTPDRQVSYDEAITMVVRALGYTDSCNELKGMSWPTNFKVKAAELDLTDDVAMTSTGADRGGVAQLIFNAMNTELVKVDSEGDVTVTANELLSRLAILDDTTYQPVGPQHIDADNTAYAGDVVDLTPYMYQDITVYTNDDEEVVYVKSSDNLVVEGVIDEAADTATAGKIIVENAAGDEYTFNTTAATDLTLNGEETTYAPAKIAYSGEGKYINVTVVLDAADDAKLKDGYNVVGIVAEKATDEVRASRDYVTGRTKINTISLPLDSDGDVELDKITVTGDAQSLEDITEDSIVTEYAAKDADGKTIKTKIVVSNDTVEGKITKVNYDSTTVTIDGTAYNASANLGVVADLAIGETGTLYLNANGEFHEFELSENSDSNSNYAMVVSRTDGVYDAFLEANDTDAKIKLATADDEEVIYKVAEEAEVNGVELVASGVNGDVLDIKNKIPANAAVEYTLDSDGKIDSIDVVTFVAANTNKPIATDTKAFVLADNAVIFDGATADKYQVLTADQLADDIIANVVYNEDGELELIVVTNVAGVELTTGTYAVINNVEVTLNSDEDTVLLITAYVDGQKVSYLTDADYYSDNIGATKTYADVAAARTALRGGFKISEFTMDGDVITGIAVKTANVGNVTAINTSNDLITLADGTVVVLADDAVVYLQTDTAVVELSDIADIDADDAATVAATEGDIVNYLAPNSDGEVEVVIIQER